MLSDRWHQVEALYHSAREREPEDRSAYLEQACGGDESLRREVESLLAHEESAANFLETDDPGVPAKAGAASVAAGERIGPYLVLEFLQKGGMGEVYQPATRAWTGRLLSSFCRRPSPPTAWRSIVSSAKRAPPPP